MKKTALLVMMVVCAAALAFGKSDPEPEVKGWRYGVCGLSGANGKEAMIELVLNADGSFHYQNLFNPRKQLNVSGSWVRKGKSIVLEGYGAGVKIHRKWKFVEKDACLKSRKGLYWIRICDLGACG